MILKNSKKNKKKRYQIKKISTVGEFKEIVSEYKKLGKIGVVFEKNANPILILWDDFISTIEELKSTKTLDGLFVRQERIYNWIMEEKVNFVFFRSIEDLGEIMRSNRMVEVAINAVEKYMNFKLKFIIFNFLFIGFVQ